MNLETALKFSNKIPGWYEKEELIALWNMCCGVVRRAGILEVGCFAGRSSALLAHFVRSLPVPVALTFIDPFLPNFMTGFDVLSAKANFRHNLRKVGVSYELIEKRTIDMCGAEVPTSIDLLHVDGDHSRCGIESDCFLLLPRVRVGGIACFHDYGRKGYIVRDVVDDLCSEWRAIGTFGTVRALQKAAPDIRRREALRSVDLFWS